ncbi:Response regulator containing CheY-like receiver domain and AraC-type DNA-binding domain [Paenibacillus sp. UNCCL117]|uniref:helix-turn-helix domain-containing protein n=1 Tax=unclassified Paenibacillus TaxID=185978 RepID=UPI000880EE75|nr:MULTISPECIES: helix-turn-helix domain-containing protein [unclassified Paenibacillus]SDE55955.1 Helix-turn-helix domain-containing protein [Paenibacillus sp. cl123]SFW66308.1 Response regulator containing CheY-like receiver domain and AraC-type DNA-binding domain [Paenibacillus sp. UNCCL117]
MRIMGRLGTVFFKLVLSYVVLIAITLAVGVISYFYFSSSFNEQVEKVNQRILSHLSQTIEDDVIVLAEKSYLSIITDEKQGSVLPLFFFDHPIAGNHTKISEIHQQLKAMVASNSAIIDSIGIYYKNNQIVIASDSGISYLDQPVTINLDWLERARKTALLPWAETRTVQPSIYSDSSASDILTFVRPYPYTSDESRIKGYIAIHLKEEAISKLLRSNNPGDKSEMLLLAADGRTISRSVPEKLYESEADKPHIRAILQAGDAPDGFIEAVEDVKTMVSYIKIPSARWSLVSLTPVDEFYKNTVPVRNTLIVICVIAIAAGLFISNMFTRNMYRPLKQITHTARQLFGAGPLPHENEYKVIGHAIDSLSVKVTELEQTLHANLPLIKHNLVLGLLHRKIRTEEELGARLDMLGMQWTQEAYYAVTFKLEAADMEHFPLDKSQFVKYNIIEHIERLGDAERMLLAIELSEQEIYAIVGCKAHDMNAVIALAEEVADYASSSFAIKTVAAIGSMVDSPLDLHLSVKEAVALLKYVFFLPGQRIYYGIKLLHREFSEEEMPEEVLERFAASLRSGKREQIQDIVAEFVRLTQTGGYSADHCHQRWRELTGVYRTFLKDIHIPPDTILCGELLEQFKNIRDIAGFEQWLLQAIDTALEMVELRSGNRTNDIIERVKKYIQAHIRSPLSLDLLAHHVSLSPRYLSRVFKDEVGMNFTDFVTNQRIDKASELILTTDLTVEQIADQVGFNSSAYFIKKFKESYGVTPKTYKHNYMLSVEGKSDGKLEAN